MTEQPKKLKSFTTLNGQLNTNPGGGVVLKWTELYNLSVSLG